MNDAPLADVPTSPTPRARRVRSVLIGLAIVSACLLAFQAYLAIARAQLLGRRAEEVGLDRADRIAGEVRLLMDRIQSVTDQFASSLEADPPDEPGLLARLKTASTCEPYLLGLTVAYAPDSYPNDTERHLYAPFYDAAKEKLMFVEDSYDYTDKSKHDDTFWYLDSAESGESVWVSGYGPAAGTSYLGYSTPVFAAGEGGGRELVAVVNAAVAMERFNELLNVRNVGSLGGGVLVDGEGLLLAYPIFDEVRAGKRLAELAAERDDPGLERAAVAMTGGGSGEVDFEGFAPGRRVRTPARLYYRPLERAGWSLGVGIVRGELDGGGRDLHRQLLGIILTSTFLAGCLLLLATRAERLTEPRLWAASLMGSIAIAVAVAGIWALALRGDGEPPGADEVPVIDLAGLDDFLDSRQARMRDRRETPPAIVPTGLFVRAIDFEDSSHVQVGGYLWQSYEVGAHDALTRGVAFPEVSADPEGLSLEEVRRERVGDREVVAWEFRVRLRERFVYRGYPFDRQSLAIRIAHPDRQRCVILAPALDRYPLINPEARPGVSEDLVLPGWSILGSRFGYKLADYNVRFADGGAVGQTEVPILEFEVELRRNFLAPFISHVVPILIVAALLHGVLISSSFSEQKKMASGFNTFGVLETCGAFFFAIILMHIDLRGDLDLDTITYLESIYLVSYALLLLVAVNSLLFTTTDAVPLLEWRDNLAAKLLFWPLFLGFTLLVTAATFY